MHMGERISSLEEAKILGLQVRAARERRELSQLVLGKLAGVERSLISKLEAGQVRTLNKSVQKICTSLGIDPHALAYDEQLGSVIRRLRLISGRSPKLLEVLDGLLRVIESAGERGNGQRSGEPEAS